MKKLLLVLLGAAVGLSASAQKKSKKDKDVTTANITIGQPMVKKEIVLKNAQDSASYAYGIMLANTIKSSDLNQEVVFDAATKANQGEAMVMTPEQANQYFNQYSTAQAAKAGVVFLANNKTRPGVMTTASGLQYEILKSGDPNAQMPTAANTVKVHYHGTNTDGSVFDSSVDRGQPIEFPLSRVIRGWTEGVQLMHIGDKFKFYIPQELAYGAASPSPKIKPYSTLIFEVELLDITK